MNQFPVYDILSDASKKWPDHPAVYDDYGVISFSRLFTETEKLRLQLIELGIKPGMGIGLMARNGRNFIIGLFAVVGCGAAVMPMSHQLKKAEIDDILDEAKLHAVLDDMSGTQPLAHIDALIPMNVESFHFSFTNINAAEIFAPHVSMPAFMRFTSGTTGKSKGVLISHQSVIERIDSANKGLGLGPGDAVIWVLPMAYHFVVSIVLYIRFGAAIAIAKDFLAKNIIEITNRHRGTLLYASPIQIRLLANDTGQDQMPSLKSVISTSAAISLEVCKAFKKRFGIDVSQAEEGGSRHPVRRLAHFGQVHFRDRDPVDGVFLIGRFVDLERRPRTEDRLTAIVIDDLRAAQSLQTFLRRQRIDRYERVDDRRLQRLGELERLVQIVGEARPVAEQVLASVALAHRTDGVRFARFAEAGSFGHDRFDLIDRDLEQQHANQLAARVDRAADEARRVVVGRQIGFVIDHADEAGCRLVANHAEAAAEVRTGVGTVLQRGREVEFLERRVDDAARSGIDQEHVVVTELVAIAVDHRMELRVEFAVLRLVETRRRTEQLVLLAQLVLVGFDEVVLVEDRIVVEHPQVANGILPFAFAGIPLLELGAELVRVVVLQLVAHPGDVGGSRLIFQTRLAKRGPEIFHRLDNHPVLGKRRRLSLDRAEVVVELLLLDRPHGGHPVKRLLHQRVRRKRIDEHADGDQRHEGRHQHRHQQLVPDTPADPLGQLVVRESRTDRLGGTHRMDLALERDVEVDGKMEWTGH